MRQFDSAVQAYYASAEPTHNYISLSLSPPPPPSPIYPPSSLLYLCVLWLILS